MVYRALNEFSKEDSIWQPLSHMAIEFLKDNKLRMKCAVGINMKNTLDLRNSVKIYIKYIINNVNTENMLK